MDYLKYVQILNLILIITLFVLWFNTPHEQFETDSTPPSPPSPVPSFPTGDSFVLADSDGNFATVSTSVIKDMITDSLNSYDSGIQKTLSSFAKTSDLINYIKKGDNVILRGAGLGMYRTLMFSKSQGSLDTSVVAGHGTGDPSMKDYDSNWNIT